MNDSEFTIHTENVLRNGYTVIPGMLTSEECDTATHELSRLLKSKEPGNFECVFNKAQIFERSYQIPELLRVVRHFLGEDAVLCAVHGSVIEPGGGISGLHADGDVTGHLRLRSQAPIDRDKRITSHAMSINTIFCISDFTKRNGATHLVPGSHLIESLGIPDDAVEKTHIIEAERGSVLLFHCNIWHGTSENRSSQNRYAMIAPWRRNWSKGPYELCRMVRSDVLERAGEEGRRIFGFDSLQPYLEKWQWDRERGEPKTEFSGLKRD